MSTERAGGVRRKKNGLFLASTVNEKNFFNKQVEIGRYIERAMQRTCIKPSIKKIRVRMRE